MPQTTQFSIPIRVLVLEPQDQYRNELVSCFREHRIEAIAVAKSEEVLWELRIGSYAVLVLDVGEDVQQVMAFIQEVRNSCSRVQIILHTTHDSLELAKQAIKLNVFGYQNKQDNCVELIDTVHRAIHQFDTLALHRAEKRFASIIDDLSDMVIRFDTHGTITFANRTFLQTFGLDPMQLAGRQIFEFVKPCEREKLGKVIKQLTAEHAVILVDIQMKLLSGTQTWCRWTNHAIFDDHDQIQEIQAALHDMTDTIISERDLLSRMADSSHKLDQTQERLAQEIDKHHQSQQRIRQHEAELSHVARLNIMGEMASSIAHELNQPLAAISNYNHGCLKRLERVEGISPAIINAMNEAAKQSERAGKIIQRLRGMVKKRDTHYQSITTQSILDDTCEFIRPLLLKQGLVLQVQNDIPNQIVYVDTIQVQQVLINMIRNAAEAMLHYESGANAIRICVYEQVKDILQVDVLDHGHGLGKVDPATLFEMFVSSRSEGMGLGLSICRTIIESHGGQCWANNREGGGAIFSFTLPYQKLLEIQFPDDALRAQKV